jgi:hypothetical protein
MSSFLRRLFGRSRVDGPRRPTNVPLPAAPDPDDLFDWSPRARPEGERPQPVGIEEAPRSEEHPFGDGPTVAPISEALSQFHRPGGPVSSRPPTVSEPGTPASPSIPPPPPPPTKPAQIRLLMGDGTVVVVSGDAELERRIGYLAENLLAPLLESSESFTPPPPPPAPAEGTETEPQLEPLSMLASVGAQGMAPVAVEVEQVEQLDDVAPAPPRGWPQMRLVFTDGSEAALPPDQEIVERLSYVIANLLPARPTT